MRLATLAGVDVGPHSLRQLVLMANTVLHERWNHTAVTLAAMYELHRDHKANAQPYTADMFHPYLVNQRKRRRGVAYTPERLRAEAEAWQAGRKGTVAT